MCRNRFFFFIAISFVYGSSLVAEPWQPPIEPSSSDCAQAYVNEVADDCAEETELLDCISCFDVCMATRLDQCGLNFYPAPIGEVPESEAPIEEKGICATLIGASGDDFLSLVGLCLIAVLILNRRARRTIRLAS